MNAIPRSEVAFQAFQRAANELLCVRRTIAEGGTERDLKRRFAVAEGELKQTLAACLRSIEVASKEASGT